MIGQHGILLPLTAFRNNKFHMSFERFRHYFRIDCMKVYMKSTEQTRERMIAFPFSISDQMDLFMHTQYIDMCLQYCKFQNSLEFDPSCMGGMLYVNRRVQGRHIHFVTPRRQDFHFIKIKLQYKY